MSARSYDVAVVGGGVSGAVAACSAASRGLSVLVCDGAPGGTGMWSGLGDFFGRTAPQEPEQLVTRLRRGATRDLPRLEVLGVADRLSHLFAAAPHHPYARMGARVGLLGRWIRAGIDILGIPGTVQTGATPVATFAGTVRRADFVAEGIGTLGGGEPPVLVGLEELPQYAPEWTGRAVERWLGRPQRTAWTKGPAALSPSVLRAAAEWGRATDGALIEVGRALADAPGAGPLFLPPVLGITFEDAARVRQALQDAAGRPVSEIAGAHESPYGLRLRDRIATALSGHAVTRRGLVQVPPTLEAGVWTVRVDGGEVNARALVLAVGGPLGRLHRGDWVEEWLGPDPRPPRNTANSPWRPQPFLERGFLVDGSLRVAGVAARDNLYACGAAVGGHDFAHDGTALGVALSTGWRVADTIAGDLS